MSSLSPRSGTRSSSDALYRMLPPLGELLQSAALQPALEANERPLVVEAGRAVLARLRREIARGEHSGESLVSAVEMLPVAIEAQIKGQLRPSLKPIINATGVLLHTNAGRAPLSRKALQHVVEIAEGYSNLEFALATGERCRRDDHVENLLLRVVSKCAGSGAEPADGLAAAVVNNCAAATFLALNSIAEGGEVLVSRGELVEIGGGFRIPDILRKSGAALREVGTTNKTRLSDYESAITPQTRLILRVHQSNFSIQGFTERPALAELIDLGRRVSLPVFEDQGTGALLPLENFGLPQQSSLSASFRATPDLIAASGDKLLGGPQCGLLVGRTHLLDQVRKNPLLRTYRVDKLTYAALEATLLSYLSGREHELPLTRMLSADAGAIRMRCEALLSSARSAGLAAEVIAVESVVGGGTTPAASLPSFALALSSSQKGAAALAREFRNLSTPIVARVQDETVLLDLRTVPPEQDPLLIRLLRELGASGELER